MSPRRDLFNFQRSFVILSSGILGLGALSVSPAFGIDKPLMKILIRLSQFETQPHLKKPLVCRLPIGRPTEKSTFEYPSDYTGPGSRDHPTGHDYTITWKLSGFVKSLGRADSSAEYYGLNPGECAYKDRALYDAEPAQLCEVHRIELISKKGKRASAWVAEVIYSKNVNTATRLSNNVFEYKVDRRIAPFQCFDID